MIQTFKQWAYSILLLVVVGAVCWAGGYYTRSPEKQIEIREVEKEVVKVVTVEKEVVKYVKVKSKDVDVKVHTEKTTETKPDGTQVVTEKTDVDHQIREKSETKKDTEKGTMTVVEKQIEVKTETQIVEKFVSPDWRVGAKVGLDIGEFELAHPTNNLVYGAEVNRRLFGTLWVGAWGLTSGQLGLSAALEF